MMGLFISGKIVSLILFSFLRGSVKRRVQQLLSVKPPKTADLSVLSAAVDLEGELNLVVLPAEFDLPRFSQMTGDPVSLGQGFLTKSLDSLLLAE